MRSIIATLFLVVLAALLPTQPAMADDLADLKAAHQKYDKAWNEGDLDTVFEIWQDGGIWLPPSQPFPVVTDASLGRQVLAKWLQTHIHQYSWYKVEYRVIGNTGLVWGVTTTDIINKATGAGRRLFHKSSMVFVNTEGRWQAVMAQSTRIPAEIDNF